MFHIAGGIILAVIFFSIVNAILDPGPPPLTREELDEIFRNQRY
jgi:hypothetical protein